MRKLFIIATAVFLCCCELQAQDSARVCSFWTPPSNNSIGLGYNYSKATRMALTLDYRHKWWGVGVEWGNPVNGLAQYRQIDLSAINVHFRRINDGSYVALYDIQETINDYYRDYYLLVKPQIYSRYLSLGIGMGYARGYKHQHFFVTDMESGTTPTNESHGTIYYLPMLRPFVGIHVPNFPFKNCQISISAGYDISPAKTENLAFQDLNGIALGASIDYIF